MIKTKKMLDISGRFLFVLGVLALTFVFAMFQGGKVSWTIFYSLLPFVMYSTFLFFYPFSEIKVKRSIRSANSQNSGKFLVTLSLKRKSRFPLLYTAVTEKWAEDDVALLAGGRLKGYSCLDSVKKLNGNMKLNRCRGESICWKV